MRYVIEIQHVLPCPESRNEENSMSLDEDETISNFHKTFAYI